jgi:hypothetical protein
MTPFAHPRLHACWLKGQHGYSVTAIDADAYRVLSARSGRTYTVTILHDGYLCDCPAHLTPYRACAVGAVALYQHSIPFARMCVRLETDKPLLARRAGKLAYAECAQQTSEVIARAYGCLAVAA